MSFSNSTTILSAPKIETRTFTLPTALLIRLGICLLCTAWCLYNNIEMQNQITELQIEIPEMAKEIRLIQEENQRLQLEVIRFESPQQLLYQAGKSEFANLRQPLAKDVLTLQRP